MQNLPRPNAINVFGELKLILLLAVLARTITILLARKKLCRAHGTDSFYTPATALSKVFTLKTAIPKTAIMRFPVRKNFYHLLPLLFLLTSAAAAPLLTNMKTSHGNILLS